MVPTKKKIVRVLVLCDDRWHPARVVRAGLGALKGGEFSFDWIENAREWSAERMAACPVVVLVKSNTASASDLSPWMTDAVQEALADHVRKGNGLLAIHSGTAGYDQMPVLRGLLGGAFTHHPEECPVTVEPRAGHPLSAGSEPFTLKDEHYLMVLDDPRADVFVTTKSEHNEQPGAWTRLEGDGRVAVLTPGHNVEVWLHPSFQALLGNLLRWCGKLT
jgi:type 1 glutamine amidotransferase